VLELRRAGTLRSELPPKRLNLSLSIMLPSCRCVFLKRESLALLLYGLEVRLKSKTFILQLCTISLGFPFQLV
jgi:hypothetical protein